MMGLLVTCKKNSRNAFEIFEKHRYPSWLSAVGAVIMRLKRRKIEFKYLCFSYYEQATTYCLYFHQQVFPV